MKGIGWRVLLVIAAVFVIGTLASVAQWVLQGREITRVVQSIALQFPQGMSAADAEQIAGARYPQHTIYSAAECERWSHSVPPYTPRGGPCLFGIIRVATTWWGFQSAVMFRLIFDPDSRLVQSWAEPVYTFL
jgi:hypothetical protein